MSDGRDDDGARIETDAFGPIEVPAGALWGAQTERSRRLFTITAQRMPLPLIHAIAQVKRVAAEVNLELGLLDAANATAIASAAARVADGEFDAQFPLSAWQTGSATQSHMNVIEVIANLASLAIGGGLGEARRVSGHDEVNLGQSSNDVVPTAIHLAAVPHVRALLAAIGALEATLRDKAARFADTIKIGRTHLQDATPVTFGQELGGHAAMLAQARAAVDAALPALHALAIGGTAVGTGLNTHPEFGARVAARLVERTGEPWRCAEDRFAALAGHQPVVALHAAMRAVAVALTKIGNDLRWLASGPRAGLAEIRLPANEPGSSIMPGKVNPTQIEALAMVCAQVMGHDVAIGLAAASGHFELNTYQPLIALNLLDSATLLTGAIDGFTRHCVAGIEADEQRMRELLDRSLMLVTALTPHVGYAQAARIARHAQDTGRSLREAALEIGGIDAAQYDAWVDPRRMLAPGR